MVKIEFNKNTINNPLQEEKKAAISFVERRLNDLNLDYKWISEENKIDLVDKIVTYYHLYADNNNGKEKRYFDLVATSWFEKIAQAQHKEDIKMIERYLGRIIVEFGAKETTKFREITAKLTELETEMKKNAVNQNRINSLKNEIIPKFTKNENDSNNLDDFYYSPIVYTYFDKNLVEEIASQNQKNTQSKNNDDARFDYSSFQELEEGKHEIVRKYKELVTKIFEDYDFDESNNKKWSRSIKEEYQKVDDKLSQEIIGRTYYGLENFHSSFSNTPSGETESVRDHNKKQLKIRVWIIEDMEKLITKTEQANDNKKRKNEESNNDLPESKRLKGEEIEKSKNEITEKIKNEQEEAKNEINNSLQGIESKSSEEQEKELEKIERQNNGQKAYQEQKEKVDKLKDSLAQSDPHKYGKLAARNITERILEAGTLILDQETQEKIENLKNGKVINAAQVRKTEEEVINQVNLAIAKKKLNELLTEIKKLGKNEKSKEKASDLFKYISDANTYHQQAYQINKSQVDKILVEKGFIKSNNKINSPSGFFQPKVLIPVAIVVSIITVIALLMIRNKKQRK